MNITYNFIPNGSTATANPGQIYIDVGNDFAPGHLDHHQASAPATCTAILVLNHPEYVLANAQGESVQLITHLYPDLDAISGIYFARAHLHKLPSAPAFRVWADYVCQMDRGETVLAPAQPLTPYSVFIMRLHHVSQAHTSPEAKSLAMLESGLDFIAIVIAKLEKGQDITAPDFLTDVAAFQTEIQAVQADWHRYQADMVTVEPFECELPRVDGGGVKTVPSLWIEQPTAILFKAWARGDALRAGQGDGFVFTGVQINPHRAILSVMPDQGVNLKGLGEALEIAETLKREKLGQPRIGQNRPGYNSPDPWYDGRSPLHAYTIVDAPHQGSILSPAEIRQVFEKWLNQFTL